MLPEPADQAAPSILSGLLAIACPIICKEGVGRIGVHDERGWLVSLLQGLLHSLNGFERDALIAPAVETEHGSLHVGGDVQWMERLQFVRFSRETSVPGDSGFDLGTVCRIQPDDATAPAKPCDTQLCNVRLSGSPDP